MLSRGFSEHVVVMFKLTGRVGVVSPRTLKSASLSCGRNCHPKTLGEEKESPPPPRGFTLNNLARQSSRGGGAA